MYLLTFKLSILVLTISRVVHAQLRFPCSQLVTERLDPVRSFNVTMDPSNDLPGLSTCTSCRFVEDKSNYWTAVMYFKHLNGSFIRASKISAQIESTVPQMANHNTGPGVQHGGMTVYYFQPREPTKDLNIVAFRKVPAFISSIKRGRLSPPLGIPHASRKPDEAD
ncbi:hypothetical protein D9611_008164 [Ephemerocybe angulata]|uniref:DUF1996 domain-containing protein n=1 Tax=Ephemerocybe angulata TaxID=980116 RepID=A0A8H5BZE5_9AGAR|nr:hypothetical protein D9611_008164 [Tulosesus angulatus]